MNAKLRNDQIETRAFAAKHKNKDVLMNSSSGGAFTAISDIFLEEGAAIVCCSYNYEIDKMEYGLMFDKASRDSARGSKYIQCSVDHIYNISRQWLKENSDKALMFVGTGCQAAGFESFCIAKNIRDRVLIVDIICHGVASPRLWKEYISELRRKENKGLRLVSFRDKRYGWKTPYAFAGFDREISLKEYMRAYYGGYSLRPSCYYCNYATPIRSADITIGDFWGIEKAIDGFPYEDGVSLILAHSQKGLAYIERIKKDMLIVSSDINSCLQPNLIHPTKKPADREKFWRYYEKKGAAKTIHRYGSRTLLKRVINKIRRSMHLDKNSTKGDPQT